LIARLTSSRRRFVLVLGVAVALAAILITASQIGAEDKKPAAAEPRATSPFTGIPQRGSALGSPKAPLTLVEYADLQCPYCGEWARMTLPVLVDRYVRTGRLRIVFSGLAFIGPDSNTGLRTAIAAGRHNHLWDVVDALYERQGGENTGWVTDELVGEIAAGVRGLDGDRLLDERLEPWVDSALERADAAAHAARVTSTPSFELGRTGGRLRLVPIRSLGPEGIVPAIEHALSR
jgi:protein-disulfide isomerase